MEKGIAFIILLAAHLQLFADPVELDLTAPPSEWQQVLESLASNGPVKSAFEETRSNPFHKRPRRFRGNIYWHPDLGLSLHYSSPSDLKINISDKHVILYRPGEDPSRMDVANDNPSLEMFFKLFDWDLEWIAENFTTEGEFEGTTWKIHLRPVDEQSRKKLSRIDLEGSANLLQSIRLDFPGGREIHIRLFEQKSPWDPTHAFLVKQFETADVEK